MSQMNPFRAILPAVALLVAACATPEQPKTHRLVEEARQAIVSLKSRSDRPELADMLKSAVGVAIFPGLYKGGFFVGAEGGDGVVLSRDAQGNWGYPAFYILASGSLGLQIGAQRAEVALVIRRRGAVEAIVNNQGKFGADVSVALAHMGAGLEGSTTSNLGPDIVAFSNAIGLFGGISMEGAALIRRNDHNKQYYGGTPTPHEILIEHKHRNPQADALRRTLAGN